MAADRYVTATGSGATCTQLSPCSLATGINGATAGETVHVDGDGGEYLGVSVVLSAVGVSVVGEGSQVPRILFNEGGTLALEGGSVARFRLGRAGGTSAVLALYSSTGSQLTVESGTSNEPVVLALSTLRDSFVRRTTEGLPAVFGLLNNTLRNVTAVATAPNSSAIGEFGIVNPFGGGCVYAGTLNAQNVIARGLGGDLKSSGAAGCPGLIEIGHSNFRALNVVVEGEGGGIVDLGGNQLSTEPLLAGDGLHQLFGSPTIDAGIATPLNGPADLDGEPRVLGAAPDIGADELPLPAPPPPPPPPTADTIAPVGSKLTFKPRRFRPRRKRAASIATARASKRRKGSPRSSRVSYRLSEDARVRFIVQRGVTGRKKGKRCVIGKQARRLPKAKKCKRFLRVKGAFSHAGRRGANSFRFSGYVRRRRLGPGVHRMLGVPVDAAGNRGRRFGTSFVITRH